MIVGVLKVNAMYIVVINTHLGSIWELATTHVMGLHLPNFKIVLNFTVNSNFKEAHV